MINTEISKNKISNNKNNNKNSDKNSNNKSINSNNKVLIIKVLIIIALLTIK